MFIFLVTSYRFSMGGIIEKTVYSQHFTFLLSTLSATNRIPLIENLIIIALILLKLLIPINIDVFYGKYSFVRKEIYDWVKFKITTRC
jgi:hypothetical protein